jgi:chemotaxis protein methyltransferase CheR
MFPAADLLFLQDLLKTRCGLALASDKAYLVASRLGPVARAHGFRGVVDLLAGLRHAPQANLVDDVIEAMATHETSFFRDRSPYEHLSAVLLPEFQRSRAGRKTIRIWSAACSSGQEPYSIAMTILESCAHMQGWRFEIVATDLSNPIVDKAARGVFSAFEVQRGLSQERLERFFVREGDSWRIAGEARQMVQFRSHNLLNDQDVAGCFDIVFCRNVLLYFDQPTKERVLNAMTRAMPSDGALFLGSAETVLGLAVDFAPSAEHRGLFRFAPSVLGRASAAGGI